MLLEAFACGLAFVLIALAVLLTLWKVGLLRNHGDVTDRFEAHRELVTGTLDLMRERAENRLEAFKEIVEVRMKAELDSMKKDLEDARAGVLGLHQRLEAAEHKIDAIATTGSLPGEGRTVPVDMEVVGGGAIGND